MKQCLFLFGAVALVSSVRADVTYSIRRHAPGVLVPELPETRVFLSDKAMLVQSWKFGYASLYQEDTLSLPAQKKRFIINRTLNIFKVEPLPENWKIPGSWAIPTNNSQGIRVVEVGQENVLGFTTQHFRLERLGPGKKPVFRNEIWIASDYDYWPLPSPQIKPKDMPSSKFSKLVAGGLIVRNEFWSSWGGSSLEKSETYELGTCTGLLLERSFYTVPKGAKLLSADAYTQALEAWNKRVLSDKHRAPMMPTTT